MPGPIVAPPFPFVKLSELKDENDPVNILYYGGGKTGKTWFLGTAGDRSLFVDTGKGTLTLKSKLFREKVGANPTIVSIEEKIGPKGIPDAARAFDYVCDVIDYALATFPQDFDTICVDDLTWLRKFAMNKGLEVNQQTGKSKTLKTIVEKYDFIIPAIQDFGVEMSLIEQFLANYIDIVRRAGKNFIVAAHQRYVFEKAAGEGIGGAPKIREIRPAVTGTQFPDTITALFDNVWHAERIGGGAGAGTVYRCTVHGDEQTVAGTRHAGVFETIERNPNFLEMLKRIRAK